MNGLEKVINDPRLVKSIEPGDIIIRLNQTCHKDSIEEMEKTLGNKLGRKVILLDARFGEILTLPPEKRKEGVFQEP